MLINILDNLLIYQIEYKSYLKSKAILNYGYRRFFDKNDLLNREQFYYESPEYNRSSWVYFLRGKGPGGIIKNS